MLRMCPTCRALLDGNESRCPHCGMRLGSARAEGVKRKLAVVLPRQCPLTTILIGANLANLLVGMVLFGPSNLLNPSGRMVQAMGALNPLLFLHGDYWRIVTYGYVHGGLVHIAFNMIALSQVGTVVENALGSTRLFVVYTLALLAGGLADVLVRGPVPIPIVGASGALFGLIGFGVAYAHFHGGEAGRAQRNFYLQWAAYGFLFGFMVRADNICHAGGFVAGALLGFLMEREQRAGGGWKSVWTALAIALLAVTLACFGWMIADFSPPR
jgi:rhomboid protease GluP